MANHQADQFGEEKIERPRRMLVPRSRRLTIDLLHYRAKVPTCAHDRVCDFRRVGRGPGAVPGPHFVVDDFYQGVRTGGGPLSRRCGRCICLCPGPTSISTPPAWPWSPRTAIFAASRGFSGAGSTDPEGDRCVELQSGAGALSDRSRSKTFFPGSFN